METDHAQENMDAGELENGQNGQNSEVPELDIVEQALAIGRVYSYVHDSIEKQDTEKKEQERTKAAKKRFLEVFSITMGTITVACEKADIARSQYYEWMKTDIEFRTAVAEIERQRVDMTEDRLFKLIQQDDGPSVRFFLERKAADYKAKTQTEIFTGDKTFEDIMYEQAIKRKALAEGKTVEQVRAELTGEPMQNHDNDPQ